MKTLLAITAALFCVLVPTHTSNAQMAQEVEVVLRPDGVTLLEWHAKQGRTYFIQSSDPYDPLNTWVWSDFIDAANNRTISHVVGSTGDKAFFRLHYTDTPPPSGVTLEAWDADGDMLPNALELEIQSHPLNPDTNGDGISDGWAHAHGHLPTANIASGLFQGGPATNLQAYQQGVQANPAATIHNRDGDELDNDLDAVPDDNEINWEKTPESLYVWIEQVTDSTDHGPPLAVNKHGRILFGAGMNLEFDRADNEKSIWDSALKDWIGLPPAGSVDVHAEGNPITFTEPGHRFIDLNDENTVFGISRGEVYSPGDELIPGMIWKQTNGQTPQYGTPEYFFPVFPQASTDNSSVSSKQPHRYASGAIANDGTVNTWSYFSDSTALRHDWMTYDSNGNTNAMSLVKALSTNANLSQSYGGAILDKDRALFVEAVEPAQGPREYRIWLKEGASQTDLSFMTQLPVELAEMSYTPPRSEQNQSTRLWITTGNKVYLEKREVGTGSGRWHNLTDRHTSTGKPNVMTEGAIRLNQRGEAITGGDPSASTPVPPKLWRNGTYTDLNDPNLTAKPSGVTIKQAIDLATNGIILVQATDGGVSKTGILVPVDIEFVFGFGPLTHLNDLHRKDLETKLSEMNPVYQDIKPGKSVFVIKGNPQGNMNANVKDTKLWTIQLSSSAEALKSALSSTPYVVFTGHSNMGLGPAFNPADIGTTSDFFNIGNPQTAINFPYLKIDYTNLNVTDPEIPETSNNYWVLPGIIGVGSVNGGIQRFENDEGILPPNAIPFHARSGMPRNKGWHFKRDLGTDENIIVNIPAGARAADLPKLGYKTFFNNACNTVRDYSEVFSAYQGSIFIGSNVTTRAAIGDIDEMTIDQSNYIFAQKLMAGESWQAILSAINAAQADMGLNNAYKLISF